VRLWDLDSGACLATFTGESEIHCCAVMSDERLFVVGEASGRVHFLTLDQ